MISTSRKTTRMTSQLGRCPAMPNVTYMLTSSVLSAMGSSNAPNRERILKRLATKPSTASERPAATNSQNAAVSQPDSTSQIASGTLSSRPKVMMLGGFTARPGGAVSARYRAAAGAIGTAGAPVAAGADAGVSTAAAATASTAAAAQHPVGVGAAQLEIALPQRQAQLRGIADIADLDQGAVMVERDELAAAHRRNADEAIAHGDPLGQRAAEPGVEDVCDLPRLLDLRHGVAGGAPHQVERALARIRRLRRHPSLLAARGAGRVARRRHIDAVAAIGLGHGLRHQHIGAAIALRDGGEMLGLAARRGVGIDCRDIVEIAERRHHRHEAQRQLQRIPRIAP